MTEYTDAKNRTYSITQRVRPDAEAEEQRSEKTLRLLEALCRLLEDQPDS